MQICTIKLILINISNGRRLVCDFPLPAVQDEDVQTGTLSKKDLIDSTEVCENQMHVWATYLICTNI